ncbi:MAG: septum formation initiator family protein [Treponema sp.]|jgi:cell division protein FtsB|nr:septum formation initiator family protein [Treponema sp.]
MRAVKYCVVLWILVTVYVVVSLIAGERGIAAYNDLLEEQKRQETNMKELERINMELENTKNALLYDRDTILVYARDLGYGEKDEKFVRIVGLDHSRKVSLFPGEVVAAGKRRYMNNMNIGIISIFAALAVFIAFLVQDILDLNLSTERRVPRQNPAGVRGVPVRPFRRVPRPFPSQPLPPD